MKNSNETKVNKMTTGDNTIERATMQEKLESLLNADGVEFRKFIGQRDAKIGDFSQIEYFDSQDKSKTFGVPGYGQYTVYVVYPKYNTWCRQVEELAREERAYIETVRSFERVTGRFVVANTKPYRYMLSLFDISEHDIQFAVFTEFGKTTIVVTDTLPLVECVLFGTRWPSYEQYTDTMFLPCGIPGESYKTCNKLPIGDSDIAALIFATGGRTEYINFGEDGSYSAYICSGKQVTVGDHYTNVFGCESWLKIYDDNGLRWKIYADHIEVYRAGEFGCVIKCWNDERPHARILTQLQEIGGDAE